MTTSAIQQAPAASPSQVFEAMGRIQKLVDEADLENDYFIQAVFGRGNVFESFTVIGDNRKGGARLASYFPGDGMVMLMGPSFYEDNPHIKEDLSIILRLMAKVEPINNQSLFPRPIEEHVELYGSSWVGGSGHGGVKLLAMSNAFDRVNIHARYDDATPEVNAFRDRIDDGMRLIVAAMNRLNHETDPRILQEVKDQKERLLGLFGNRKIYVHELPNGYGGKDDPYWGMFPWFQVTTDRGPIKIGWRKRVINIDWSESDIAAVEGHQLFSGEQTTVGDHYVHAWGYEKAKEYLDAILNWEPTQER